MQEKGRKRIKKDRHKKSRGRLVARIAFSLFLLAFCATCSWFGRQWIQTLPVREVQVASSIEIPEDEVLALASVDTTATLFSIEPEDVAIRVLHHPWVSEVSVDRIPNGTLRIRISPRKPVARLIDNAGRPGVFVDGKGYLMPDRRDIAFNVPLIRGAQSGGERMPVEDNPMLMELLSALADSDEYVDALISEIQIERNRNTVLYLTPAAGQETVKVALGRSDFAGRLDRLSAYWQQVVVWSYPGEISEIDLRFDSQIVVRHL